MYSKFSLRFGTFLTLFFLVFPSAVFAGQTILLRNGGKIVGEVVGQNERSIVIQSGEGKKTTVHKREILKIIYKEVSKEEEKKIRLEEEKKIKENPQIVQEPIQVEPAPVVDSIKSPAKSRWSAVWRSAVFPGWGQWYIGKKSEARLTFAGFGSALAVGIYARIVEDSAKRDYDAAVSKSSVTGAYIYGGGIANYYLLTVVPNARSDYDQSVHRYNESIYILTSVYLAQLVRSYYLGKAWENETEASPVVWTVVPKPDYGMGHLGWGAEASFTLGY